jgi:hypothetical protein
MRRRPPLEIGTKYNDWVVIRQIDLNRAVGRCKCNTEQEISIKHVLSGRSKRCRTCANKRPSYKWRPINFDGNEQSYPTKLKTAVNDAIARCVDKNHKCYKNWGKRGITVYQNWLKDPRLFIEYLMTLEGWDNPELILDRINNDGNYEPGNLRWATYIESAQNQRHSSPTIMTTERVSEAVELRKLDSKRWTYRTLGERYEATPSAVYAAIKNRGNQ